MTLITWHDLSPTTMHEWHKRVLKPQHSTLPATERSATWGTVCTGPYCVKKYRGVSSWSPSSFLSITFNITQETQWLNSYPPPQGWKHAHWNCINLTLLSSRAFLLISRMRFSSANCLSRIASSSLLSCSSFSRILAIRADFCLGTEKGIIH